MGLMLHGEAELAKEIPAGYRAIRDSALFPGAVVVRLTVREGETVLAGPMECRVAALFEARRAGGVGGKIARALGIKLEPFVANVEDPRWVFSSDPSNASLRGAINEAAVKEAVARCLAVAKAGGVDAGELAARVWRELLTFPQWSFDVTPEGEPAGIRARNLRQWPLA